MTHAQAHPDRDDTGGVLHRLLGLEPFIVRRVRKSISGSLFFIPAVIVAIGVALSQITVQIDQTVDNGTLPGFLRSTVESSRSILAAIAGGTITAASIMFSLTLVAVQLAASQFSPRVLRNLLADRFQQVVMGTVVGTFIYSLLVLREIRQDDEQVAGPFLPQVSIAVAVLLALLSLVAVLASIDHTAKSLRVGSVADRILRDTVEEIHGLYRRHRTDSDDDGDDGNDRVSLQDPAAESRRPESDTDGVAPRVPDRAQRIDAPESGWILDAQPEKILEVLDRGQSILLPVAVGSYVIHGMAVAYVWTDDDDGGRARDTELHDPASILDYIAIGGNRTIERDIGFGILQLSDIALRALSPGVNDPNTAIEIVERMGAILLELYRHELPTPTIERDGSRLHHLTQVTHADFVDRAIEPIRRKSRSEPRVLEAIVRVLRTVIAEVDELDADVSTEALHDQIDLLRDERGLLETDADQQRLTRLLDTP